MIFGSLIDLYISYPKRVVEKTSKGQWTSRDQSAFDFLYGFVPGVKQTVDLALDERRRQEYFNAHHMDYGDVHDPRNLPGAGNLGQAFGWIVNFTSHNLNRLYGDKE